MIIQGLNWYVAKLVYEIDSDATQLPQFDIQFRVIRADDQDWAVEKANTLGKLGENKFLNRSKQSVHWKFVGVVDLVPVASFEDDTLIYSETKTPTDASSFKINIRQRAIRLQEHQINR